MTKNKTTPLPVEFRDSFKDFAVAELAELGLTHGAIAEVIGYTPAQVGYRLRLAGISTMVWRRGNSPLQQRLMVVGKRKIRCHTQRELRYAGVY